MMSAKMSESSLTETINPALQDHGSDNLKCDCKKHKFDGRRRRLVVAFDGTENEFGPEVCTNIFPKNVIHSTMRSE